MSKEWFKRAYVCTKPFMLMIFLQTSYAVNGLVVKSALNKGLNHYTFAVYRNAIAALFFGPFAFFLERKVRPKMTISIFLKILLMGLLEPVIDQNLYFAGMKLTTATFAAAMCNIVPAITFVMAWILRYFFAYQLVLLLYIKLRFTYILSQLETAYMFIDQH
ncbi:putative EamA domain-containing protein [Helianthus annuus]|nr:putative EamA domain-containing protein [Helianthus annuus]